jgi:hypothetical protein
MKEPDASNSFSIGNRDALEISIWADSATEDGSGSVSIRLRLKQKIFLFAAKYANSKHNSAITNFEIER